MTPMKRVAVRWLCMGVMAWVAGAGVAQATLVLEGTRIVYPEKAKDVSIRVRNPGSYPILAQSWLDDGRPDLSPEVMVVPFIVSPALTRVEPDGSALLRVFHAKRPLPTDRESLFYLNVMETPPRSSEENALTLQFRTRVKLFFRPTGLSGDAGDAPDSLKWTLVPGAGAVEVHNPTPYHVSFLSVELETAGRREILDRAGQDAMVAPFSKLRFPVSAGRNPCRAKVRSTTGPSMILAAGTRISALVIALTGASEGSIFRKARTMHLTMQVTARPGNRRKSRQRRVWIAGLCMLVIVADAQAQGKSKQYVQFDSNMLLRGVSDDSVDLSGSKSLTPCCRVSIASMCW